MTQKELESVDRSSIFAPTIVLEMDDDAEEERRLREAAFCFAQEFIAMGWSPKNIACLFQEPFYREAYNVYRIKGPAFVEQAVCDAHERYREQLSRLFGHR